MSEKKAISKSENPVKLDGYVLLLGVDHSSNTSIHLVEARAEYSGKKVVLHGAPLTEDQIRNYFPGS